jgi:hypothetical protein
VLRSTCLTLVLGALLALASASLLAEGEEPGQLFVKKAKLVQGPGPAGEPGDSLTLHGTFAALDLPRFYFPETDVFELRMGGTRIVTFGLEDGTRWKPGRGFRRWTGIAAGTAGSPGTARLRIDYDSGRFRLKVRGVDLDSVRSGGPAGLEILVRLGGEHDFARVVDFTVKEGHWSYKSPRGTPRPAGRRRIRWPGWRDWRDWREWRDWLDDWPD